jgi:hypothetical protein
VSGTDACSVSGCRWESDSHCHVGSLYFTEVGDMSVKDTGWAKRWARDNESTRARYELSGWCLFVLEMWY